MTHINQIRRVYHGANVRVEHRGDSLNGSLVVQKINKLSGDWLDHSTFDKIADSAYSDANRLASSLTFI